MQAIHNQSKQNLELMPSVTRGEAQVHPVPWVLATGATLAGYGRLAPDFDPAVVDIVTWPAPSWRPIVSGTGNQAGVVQGNFKMRRMGGILYAANEAVKHRYITGWYGDPALMTEASVPQHRRYLLTHEANYHPDGGQVFFPRTHQPFVALLAKPGDDVRPQDFSAFYFDGSCGVHINPNVWHQPMFPVGDVMTFKDAQGAVHACVSVDFLDEFGCYLQVPLVRSPKELS